MYLKPCQIPGHDFSGIVESIHPDPSHGFKPGDKVFGMVKGDHGGCWAEYAIVTTQEVGLMPKGLSWEEAASVPLSALTAWQALFIHGGVERPQFDSTTESSDGHKRVLITGAAGGVGLYLVQFAKLAGCHVLASSSSNERNGDFLKGLGADEVQEYSELGDLREHFDLVVDTVGGKILEGCWNLVSKIGTLVSVDSTSFDFIAKHREAGIAKYMESINAVWFIVEPSLEDLDQISKAVEFRSVRSFVAATMPLARAKEAYDLCHGKPVGRGKIVLTI